MRATAVVQIDVSIDNPAEERDLFAWWADARRLLAERARPLRLELLVSGRGRYQIELAAAFPGGVKLVTQDRPWLELEARRPRGALAIRELRLWRDGTDLNTTTLRAWLAERAAGTRDFVLANALTERSFAQRRIQGSVSLPAAAITADLAERVIGGRNRPVVVYCAGYGCGAGARAAARLEEVGFAQVFEYTPGLAEWEQDGQVEAGG
jgi:rhodanese-related sulfurtransferase